MPFRADPDQGILRDPGSERERLDRGDPQGLPQAGVALSSRPQSGRRHRRGAFQGHQRGLRRPDGPRQAQALRPLARHRCGDPRRARVRALGVLQPGGYPQGSPAEPGGVGDLRGIDARVPAHGVSLRRRLRPSHVLWRSRRGLRWDLLRRPLWPPPGDGRRMARFLRPPRGPLGPPGGGRAAHPLDSSGGSAVRSPASARSPVSPWEAGAAART